MRTQFFPPAFKEPKFHCLFCNVLSQQRWYLLTIPGPQFPDEKPHLCTCGHCSKNSYWIQENLVFPASAPVEQPHPSLPEVCLGEYDEAREVFAKSPRAAAALLRLSIQKLLPALGEKGKNINDDIQALVARGLSPMVQQALDICRVVGNNAVHPGEINLNDTPEIAQSLFRILNIIVEEMIAKPAEVKALYDSLPQAARDAIAKRDTPNAS